MSKKPAQLVLGVNGFSLPVEAITESIGILAKRRAGKSTTARRLTEQFFHAKQQVVIVDPKGDWWGLLYARDGKRPGLPFIVLGGGHGHIPLELHAGEVVARLAVQERVNLVLDLSHFRRDDVPTFMTPFLETMYRLKADEQYRTAMTLIIDEADTIAPQKPDRGGERLMASAVEDIVRRGGQRGMGCVMITQRTAELSKSALTQIGILMILRTIAPQDLKAMDAWVAVHGTPIQRFTVRESLPTMKQGEAFVWAPGWPSGLGIFERVQMALPDTYDSSSTPTAAGQRARAPKHAARVNLTALQTRMAATFAAVKENDPRELKQALAAARAAVQRLQEKFDALKSASQTRAQLRKLETLREYVTRQHQAIVQHVTRLHALDARARDTWDVWRDERHATLRNLEAYLSRLTTATPGAPAAAAPPPAAAVVKTNGRAPRAPAAAAVMEGVQPGGNDAIGKGELEILRAIAGRGHVTREYVTLTTGYKKSTRNAYIQRLAARGLIQADDADRFDVTPAGRQVAGPVETPPRGAGLVDWWQARLPAGEASLFKLIATEGVTNRETLTERTGLKKSTRNAYLQRLARRGLIVVDDDDAIRPHAELTGEH